MQRKIKHVRLRDMNFWTWVNAVQGLWNLNPSYTYKQFCEAIKDYDEEEWKKIAANARAELDFAALAEDRLKRWQR